MFGFTRKETPEPTNQRNFNLLGISQTAETELAPPAQTLSRSIGFWISTLVALLTFTALAYSFTSINSSTADSLVSFNGVENPTADPLGFINYSRKVADGNSVATADVDHEDDAENKVSATDVEEEIKKSFMKSAEATDIPQKPVCVLTSWASGGLPSYVRASLDSFASANKPDEVTLYLFVAPDSTGHVRNLYAAKKKTPTNTASWPKSVNVVDIGTTNGRWRRGGWKGLISDRLCDAYGLALTSRECEAMGEAVKNGRRSVGSALVELRPFYGKLFEPWINASTCSAWAWADLDTLWGDLSSVMNTDLFLKHSDVLTIQPGLITGLYAAGQFTAFNLLRRPEIANDLWRGCEELRDVASAICFFDRSNVAILDEGCLLNVLVKKRQLTYAVVRLQDGDWEGLNVVHSSSSGVLTTCKSRKYDAWSREVCRALMKRITSLATSSASSRSSSPFRKPPANFSTLAVAQPGGREKVPHCSAWLRSEVTWCAVDPKADDPPGSNFWVPLIVDGRVERALQIRYLSSDSKYVQYAVRAGGGGEVEVVAREAAVAHLQSTKYGITYIDDLSGDEDADSVDVGGGFVHLEWKDGRPKEAVMRYGDASKEWEMKD